MKLPYVAYLAFVGALSFLVLFIVDREKEAGVERLSQYEFPHNALEDPNLKLISTHSPYMRTER